MSTFLDRVKQLLLVLIIVFIGAAGGEFLLKVTDIWHTSASTWQLVVNAGVIAVVTYVVALIASQNKAVAARLGLTPR